MSSRGEYFSALVTASPTLIGILFLSMLLCGCVFVGAAILRKKKSHDYAASLPLQDDDDDVVDDDGAK